MNIKELRSQTGLSQAKFAAKFHINPMNISYWERGYRTPPDYVVEMMEIILQQEKEIAKLKGKRAKKK